MNYKTWSATLVGVFLLNASMATPVPQDKPTAATPNDTPLRADDGNTVPPARDGDKPQGANRQELKIDVSLEIALDPAGRIPNGATASLDVEEQNCTETHQMQPIQNGKATFHEVPKCKVKLRIFITGVNSGVSHLDLKEDQTPVTIRLKIKPDGTTERVMSEL